MIDQTLILNDTSSRLHHFEIPSYFEFLKHVEPQLDLNNPISDNYSSIMELNVSINLSLIDPVKYDIFDLDTHVLKHIYIKYEEKNEFVDPHE